MRYGFAVFERNWSAMEVNERYFVGSAMPWPANFPYVEFSEYQGQVPLYLLNYSLPQNYTADLFGVPAHTNMFKGYIEPFCVVYFGGIMRYGFAVFE